MSVATELLTSISQDEKERAIYRSRMMYITDMESNIRTAEKRGEERGEERGIAIGNAKLNQKLSEIILSLKLNLSGLYSPPLGAK